MTLFTVFAAMALILASCGGGESVPTATTADAAESSEVVTTTTESVEEDHEHEEETDPKEGDHEEERDSTETTVASDVDAVIEVVMNEFTFEPGSIEVHAGQTVLFRVTNEGAIEHEFRLSNVHRVEEHLASGHEDHGDEGDGDHHDEGGDVLILLGPGETGEMTLTFPDDATLYTAVVCLLPGHYEAGMFGEIEYGDA
ncbi:MAG: cupredoxin domain-containing protein [Actinomycetota bacterium]|nr:cupredoxin domain-containing protein [Actinomycetota bacterium]